MKSIPVSWFLGSIVIRGDSRSYVSFLSLPKEETYGWTKNPSASRAFESFLTEKRVGLKIKRKILRNLEGKFAEMAKDKYGCHIVDRCWAVADIKQKVRTVGAHVFINAGRNPSPKSSSSPSGNSPPTFMAVSFFAIAASTTSNGSAPTG